MIVSSPVRWEDKNFSQDKTHIGQKELLSRTKTPKDAERTHPYVFSGGGQEVKLLGVLSDGTAFLPFS
jgi:hypothetical protein